MTVVAAELQTADVACFQRKIQLSGCSEYPDGSPYQLIRINGDLRYVVPCWKITFGVAQVPQK